MLYYNLFELDKWFNPKQNDFCLSRCILLRMALQRLMQIGVEILMLFENSVIYYMHKLLQDINFQWISNVKLIVNIDFN